MDTDEWPDSRIAITPRCSSLKERQESIANKNKICNEF